MSALSLCTHFPIYYIMFLYLLLLHLCSGLSVSPVNTSCIWGAQYTLAPLDDTIFNRHYALPTITLPPFSLADIWFDFRQVSLQEEYYRVYIEMGDFVETISNYTNKASLYSLFVTQESNLSITIQLDEGHQLYKYLLINSTTVNVTQAQPRFTDKYSTFLWVVKQNDNIELPFNFPSIKNFNGYYFNRVQDNQNRVLAMQDTIDGVNYYSQNAEYWSTLSSFTVPYLPYVSNCKKTGHYTYASREFENPNYCNIVPINETAPINPFFFGSSAYGDSCDVELECIYDESLDSRHEHPLWMTLPQKSNLMYITKHQISSEDYSISYQFDDQDLIPCIIQSSQGGNSSTQFPTAVEITLGYYQVSQTQKTMISCSVAYSLYTTATPNFTYTVSVILMPLNHTSILIAFGFAFYIYMIAFVVIGIISNGENLILGVYHFVANKLVRKCIKVKVYLPLLWEVLKGSLIAIIPMLGMGCLITLIMGGHFFGFEFNHFGNTSPTAPKVFWDLINNKDISDYSSVIAETSRDGRLGVAFISVGIYIILRTSDHFVGMERKKEDYQQQEVYGSIISPLLWAKFKFLFGTVVYICLQLFLMYFAFSNFFGQNIWTFIVLTKVGLMILEQFVDIIFQNTITCMPLKIISNLTSYLNTLAANDFYSFMFSFLIDVAIQMSQKAYLATMQNITANYVDNKMKQLSMSIDKFLYDGEKEESLVESDMMSEDSDQHQIQIAVGINDVSFQQSQGYETQSVLSEDQIQVDQYQMVYKQRLVETNQKKMKEITEIVHWTDNDEAELLQRTDLLETVVDVFSVPVNTILQPFAILILWMTYNETSVLSNFGITQQITPFYIFSNLTIGPFTIINTILTLFILENFHQFELEEFIVDNMERYNNRRNFWKSHDDEVPTDCEVKVRGVVKFCVSSQLFFLVVIYICGMFFVVAGASTIISHNYDPFYDFTSLLVSVFWLLSTHLTTNIMILFATRIVNIWDYKHYNNGTKVFIDEESNKDIDISRHKLTQRGRQKSQQECQENLTRLNYEDIVIDQSWPETVGEQSNQEQKQRHEELKETKAKITGICNRFKPVFEDPIKIMEYSHRNKDYFIQNIDRILDGVELEELPEDVRNCETNLKHQVKSQTTKLNLNQIGQKMIKEWLQVSNSKKIRSQSQALQNQKAIKACKFCFNNWGIYYGHGGICLECTEQMVKLKKE